jgi:hypothetical protein
MGPALWESGPGENPLRMALHTNIRLTNNNMMASKLKERKGSISFINRRMPSQTPKATWERF